MTAAAGLAGTALSSLFTAGAFAWAVQPSLLVPIFDAGANQGNLDVTIATREAAAARRGSGARQLRARGCRQGIESYLSTLAAQRALYTARGSLVSTRLVRAENLVELYRAIGSDPV